MNGDSQNFFLEQQRAVERMKESASRSRYAPTNQQFPNKESKGTLQDKKQPQKPQPDAIDSIPSPLDIPILNRIKTDRDTALILGIVLLLTAEKSDRLLLLALMYILL